MVKFGRYLNTCRSHFAPDTFVDYKSLKKRLKRICGSRCDGCAGYSDPSYMPCGDGDEADAVQETFISRIQGEACKLNRFVTQAKAEVKTVEELHDLAIFVEINRIALLKIVKKIEKKCGPCCGLQSFLQYLDEEPFVTSLADAIPQARAELQTRLLLAGVRREIQDAEVSQNEEIHITVADTRQITSSEPNLSQRPRGHNMASHHRMLSVLCRSRSILGLASLACFPLIAFWILRHSGVISDTCMSVLCGSHLLVTTVAVIWNMASLCSSIGSQMTPGPLVRDCVLQQLRYAELSMHNFTPSFVLMRVSRGRDEVATVQVIQKQEPEPQVHGTKASNTIPSTCGCCLEKFRDDDCVVLLPCYHVFCDECIMSWAISSAKGGHSCPMCRSTFARNINRV